MAAAPNQAWRRLRDDLVRHGLLLESGVPGLYGRGAAFERVREGLDRELTRAFAGEKAEHIAFPPAIPRWQLESSGYLRSFPHLAGSVFSFREPSRRQPSKTPSPTIMGIRAGSRP